MFFKVLFVFDIFVVDDDYNFLWQECGKPLYMENNRDGILIFFFFLHNLSAFTTFQWAYRNLTFFGKTGSFLSCSRNTNWVPVFAWERRPLSLVTCSPSCSYKNPGGGCSSAPLTRPSRWAFREPGTWRRGTSGAGEHRSYCEKVNHTTLKNSRHLRKTDTISKPSGTLTPIGNHDWNKQFVLLHS